MDFEILKPDPILVAQVNEILRQNALILDMNRDLIAVLSHPQMVIDKDFKGDKCQSRS